MIRVLLALPSLTLHRSCIASPHLKRQRYRFASLLALNAEASASPTLVWIRSQTLASKENFSIDANL